MVEPPEQPELWAEYVATRKKDPKKANQLYIDRRDDMDAGAVVSNPYRAVASKGELSTLQHYYNQMADNGEDFVLCEYDNNPPEIVEEDDERVKPEWYQEKIGTLERGLLPEGTVNVTAAIDCGKYELHWLVMAWLADGTSRLVDIGVEHLGTKRDESTEGAEFKFSEGISDLWDNHFRDAEYMETNTGELMPIDLVYIDAGYLTHLVYEAVRSKNSDRFKACMGTGDRNTATDLRRLKRKQKDKEIRNGCMQQQLYRPDARLWLNLLDSNFWRAWIRERMTTGPNNTGSMRWFKPDTQDDFGNHEALGRHLAGDWFEDGKWKQNKRNHWGDSLYYAAAAAGRLGVRLSVEATPEEPKRKRISLAKRIKARRKQRDGNRFGRR